MDAPGNGDDPKKVLSIVVTSASSETTRVGVPDAHLSKAASRVVKSALEKVVDECKKACTELWGQSGGPGKDLSTDDVQITSSSTQILVPVHPFPEESIARLPASPSFAGKHTMQYDSKLDGGLELHREDGLFGIGNIEAGAELSNGTPAGGGESPGEPGLGDQQQRTQDLESHFSTLIEQMADSVARAAEDGLSLPSFDYFQDLTKRFTDLAKAACGLSVNVNCRLERCRGEYGAPPGVSSPNTSSPNNPQRSLPPEVKERIIRTLSEIRAQLDMVKGQLKEKSVTPRS